jgi:hypothetical protein
MPAKSWACAALRHLRVLLRGASAQLRVDLRGEERVAPRANDRRFADTVPICLRWRGTTRACRADPAGTPRGRAVVTLSSSNATVAGVPAGVTVAAGATSANFSITTTGVAAATSVTIGGSFGGVSQTATLTVNPPAPPAQTATLSVTATGRSGERVSSSPAGISVAVGSTGSATFNTGTSITLSVTNTRDAIWSGACSSGGNKVKTCTFTIQGNASVTANVQ